mmetsp:Transcript_10982/g.12058  ORF Transcript_10982/g.12058 Transcript_10982/m.12058 type:complete len:179 (-) Transcript_10982:79-615(-)
MSSSAASLFLVCVVLVVAQNTPNLRVPIKFTFNESFTCGNGNFSNSGLWLSPESPREQPDMLFDMSCGDTKPGLFLVPLAGDLAVYCDAGAIPLTNVSAEDYQFASCEPAGTVEIGHSYFVIIARSYERVMFAFHVDKVGPIPATTATSMDITYGVFIFEQIKVINESPGFSWSKPIA